MNHTKPENSLETFLVEAGFKNSLNHGMVNTPVYKTTTKIFSKFENLTKLDQKFGHTTYSYGRCDTPTTHILLEVVKKIERAKYGVLFSSGLNAITMSLLAVLKPNDHLIIAENCYLCTRRFAEETLRDMQVEVEFIDICDYQGLKGAIKENTKCILFEAPGSQTFEVPDIDLIVQIAKARKILTIFDNTWGTPLNFDALKHGLSIAVQSLTKYYSGHADAFMGVATTNDHALYGKLFKNYINYGAPTNPEDAYSVLKGIKTLSIRLDYVEKNAIQVAQWLRQHPKVCDVLHPALPGFGQSHENFRKYFKASTGTFSFTIDKLEEKQLNRFINTFKILKIGLSWGGFESLIMPIELESIRAKMPKYEGKTLVRIYVGLENAVDLIADLSYALDTL